MIVAPVGMPLMLPIPMVTVPCVEPPADSEDLVENETEADDDADEIELESADQVDVERIEEKREDLRQKRRDLEETLSELDGAEEACVERLAELGVNT